MKGTGAGVARPRSHPPARDPRGAPALSTTPLRLASRRPLSPMPDLRIYDTQQRSAVAETTSDEPTCFVCTRTEAQCRLAVEIGTSDRHDFQPASGGKDGRASGAADEERESDGPRRWSPPAGWANGSTPGGRGDVDDLVPILRRADQLDAQPFVLDVLRELDAIDHEERIPRLYVGPIQIAHLLARTTDRALDPSVRDLLASAATTIALSWRASVYLASATRPDTDEAVDVTWRFRS